MAQSSSNKSMLKLIACLFKVRVGSKPFLAIIALCVFAPFNFNGILIHSIEFKLLYISFLAASKGKDSAVILLYKSVFVVVLVLVDKVFHSKVAMLA